MSWARLDDGAGTVPYYSGIAVPGNLSAGGR